MKREIKVKAGVIEIIVGSYKGVQTYHWGGYRYKHKIVLTYNGKKVSFTFYNSEWAFQEGREYLNEKDMMEALDCILSDALFYYDYSLDDFITSFYDGNKYDEIKEIKEAKKTYNACGNTYNKLTNNLGLSANDIVELRNSFNDN